MVPDVLDSIKTLAAEFRRLSKESVAENPARSKRNAATADNLEATISELETARRRLRPLTELGDLTDLPDEVLKELNLSKVDELERQLRDIVASGNGSMVTIDQILVELWRRNKVAKPRTFIMNKLYRMAQKGSVQSAQGKKGSYYVPNDNEPPQWDAGEPFGDEGDIPF